MSVVHDACACLTCQQQCVWVCVCLSSCSLNLQFLNSPYTGYLSSLWVFVFLDLTSFIDFMDWAKIPKWDRSKWSHSDGRLEPIIHRLVISIRVTCQSSMMLHSRFLPSGLCSSVRGLSWSKQLGPAAPALTPALHLDTRRRLRRLTVAKVLGLLLSTAHTYLRPILCVSQATVLPFLNIVHEVRLFVTPLWDRR